MNTSLLVIFLIIRRFLTFFMKPFTKPIEEEKGEPPIKKLSPEILGVIFSKMEYEDVQKFKNLSKFLSNAHKSKRRIIVGPTCEANVYYNKNKELRLQITIMVTVPWIRILPFKRTIAQTRTIPFDQWNYYFENAKCKKLNITVEEGEIPLEILKEILCCKSIEILSYSGKSINQMTIDFFAAYKPRSFEIVLNDWSLKILDSAKHTLVMIECLTNIDDVVEALKFTYDSIINLKPKIYEKMNIL
ncbi:unnamed protein product [Caenorhabditis angaria]|uniref:F-box domain-containing protein n=1 Tax=Caenorhabditis angaria TaxID=860376 RepID=A0A9P1IL15_9PELO|nr:unnamed protein product [Caenorhabditis angaria]